MDEGEFEKNIDLEEKDGQTKRWQYRICCGHGYRRFWFPLSATVFFLFEHFNSSFRADFSQSVDDHPLARFSRCLFPLFLSLGARGSALRDGPGITNTLPALADYVWLSLYPRHDLVLWFHSWFQAQPPWLWLPVMQ